MMLLFEAKIYHGNSAAVRKGMYRDDQMKKLRLPTGAFRRSPDEYAKAFRVF